MGIPVPTLMKPKAVAPTAATVAGIPNPAGASYPPKAAPTTSPVPAPGSVDSAQAWINNPASGMGGLDAYSQKQNDRFQTASAANDTDTIGKLQADSQRVGYTLNPYKAAVPDPAPVPNTTAPTAYTDWQAKQNELLAKYEALMSQDFTYNPETDPKYQAFKTLSASRADAAAKTATRSTEEEMNARGILNSTVTSSQLGQIQQNAKQTAETEALAQLPAYEAQARQGFQDKLRNAADLLTFSAGRGDQAYQNEYTRNRDELEDDRYDDETAYSRSEDNPLVKGQMQQNILNQYKIDSYPEEQKAAATKIQHELALGKMDVETAEYNLKQLKDPNSAVNQISKLELQMKQLEAKNLPEKERLALATARKNLAEIGVTHYKPQTAAEIEQDKVTLAVAKKQLADIEKGKYPGDKVVTPETPKPGDYKLKPDFATDVAYIKANPEAAAMLDTQAEKFILAYGYDGYNALREAAGLQN